MAKPAPPQQLDVPALRRLLPRLSGARLCYGKPVRVGDRAVIPVASVRMAGGGGGGRRGDAGAHVEGGEAGDVGGGGGGALDARPLGFIEVGPDGTRFERIASGRSRLARVGAAAATLLLLGAARRRLPRPALPDLRPRARRLRQPPRGRLHLPRPR